MIFQIKKYIFVFSLLFMTVTEIVAQQGKITGIVKDSLLSKALENSTITLMNFQTGSLNNNATNKNGEFAFNHLQFGDYSVEVKFIGYRTFFTIIKLSESNPVINFTEIKLQGEEGHLSSVTVTSTNVKQFITQSPNKIILNIAQSPIASGGNALDAISRGPGIVEQSGTITFRNKKVAILIDGKLSNLSGDDLKDMLISLPANTIDKIEIIPSI